MVERHGPLRVGRFIVEIDDVEVPGWHRVQLPANHTQEGEGSNPYGTTVFQDLEMERTISPGDTVLVDWRDAIMDGDEDDGTRELAVILQNEDGEAEIIWTFTEAWPKSYIPPTLDPSADDDVATEKITVAFDEMQREEA